MTVVGKTALAALACAFPLAVPAAAEPLVVDHDRLFVTARINGVPTEALIDSGAEATLIDPRLAAAAKLSDGERITIRGSGGIAEARFVSGVTIEALGQTLALEGVVVTDLTDLSRRLIKRPTQAIVGRELFDAVRLEIDIEGGTIRALGRDRVPAGKRLPLKAHAGIEAIPAAVNGQPAQAEFDLGNGSDLLISRAFASRQKLKVRGRETGGGIGGEVTRDIVLIKRLDVAGRRFRNVRAAIDDLSNANELNIGTSILRHFILTTDFSARAVYFAPRNGEN